MLQHILWGITFFTLWLTIVWIQFLYFGDQKKPKVKEFPKISIAVPAYNEAKTIKKTITSLVKADYPKDKIEIIVVNDGSKDDTRAVVEKLARKYASFDIKLINKKNGGKSSAVNAALKIAEGDLFAVVDADSRISPNCLKLIVPHFLKENIAAVISRVKVDNPKILLERIQRFEYIMSNMIRKLMAVLGTLSITPGVLSVYHTDILRKVGGFTKDRTNLTEDLEIAMRLRYNCYDIEMDTNSITHTLVPQTLKALWNQRIRWARGYIVNHWKYRSMLFSKRYGLYGLFQMPVNIIVVILLMINIGIISYSLLTEGLETLVRSLTIEGYLINRLLDFPTIKHLMLGQNLRIMIPLAFMTVLGFYLIFLSHRQLKENVFKNITGTISYFLFIPYFTTVNWISSIYQEISKTKRKW
jgi:cellulose synthase/poly-beta-1,6-N-acetylglucosamine synthase-like glycosyltransferase